GRVPAITGEFPSPKGGNLVLVDLLVAVSQPSSYVIIDDPVPAGLEIVDTRPATPATSSRGGLGALGGIDWDAFGFDYSFLDPVDYAGRSSVSRSTRQNSTVGKEFRDDRAVFFVEEMAAGMYRYRYLARATTIGRFIMPPTRVESMYQPELYGRTGAAVISVVP
ncbi:MAG: hypothetical protein FWD57_14610, partial [Polyangiaceae bacterium]|nr:hypothetical protein [Polyangiaceae bacterium]